MFHATKDNKSLQNIFTLLFMVFSTESEFKNDKKKFFKNHQGKKVKHKSNKCNPQRFQFT